MTKTSFLFLFAFITILSPTFGAKADEKKNYATLPKPAPLAASMDPEVKAPAGPLLSDTFPSRDISAAQTQHTTNSNTVSSQPPLSLIHQLVSQNLAEPSGAFGPVFSQILNSIDDHTSNNQTYDGLRHFWHMDILNSVTSIGSFISNFINNLTSIYLPYIVGYLCAILKSFFLNTDLTRIEDATASNDLSCLLTQLANTIYGITIDLSLLLFILSIWRYWTQSAWHGSGSPMSAIGRLIATFALMLAWTTIYKFQIELSNEMLSTLFSDSAGQIQFFDLVMSTTLHKTSALPNTSTLLAAIPATEYVPAVNGITEGIVAMTPIVLSIILIFLAIVLIYELLYLIVLKAIQTALLTAQYVFAPFFLVFLCNPVTDNITSSFLRSFVEVSLWNFIWIGLLKILIILLYSNFNPWGKILTAIGVLQLMMQVPQFLAHAKISAASDFVSPHFFAKALKDVSSFDSKIKDGINYLRSTFSGTSSSSKDKENPITNVPRNDNFSFTGNDGNNIIPQPPKKFNSVNGHSSPENSQPDSKADTNPNTAYRGFTAGSAEATGAASALGLTTGRGSAFASATSTAIASSVAMAMVTKPTRGDGPNPVFPPGPNSPKPGPSDPGSGPSPKPDSGSPKPAPAPSAGPFPKKPNSGLPRLTSSFPLLLENAHFPLDFGAHNNRKIIGQGPKAIFGTASNLSPLPNPQIPKEKVVPPGNSLYKLEKGFPSDTHKNKKQMDNINQNNNMNDSDKRLSPPSKAHTFGDPFTSPTAGIYNSPSKSPGQITLRETYAFQSGALNYHLYKNGRRSSLGSGAFYHPYRTYGAVEGLRNLYAYNLIFSHGNSPPLMGIPPIYPAPNKT